MQHERRVLEERLRRKKKTPGSFTFCQQRGPQEFRLKADEPEKVVDTMLHKMMEVSAAEGTLLGDVLAQATFLIQVKYRCRPNCCYPVGIPVKHDSCNVSDIASLVKIKPNGQ